VSTFIDRERSRFGVEPIYRTLGVSASAYYKRPSGRSSRRAVEDGRLLAKAQELHRANYSAYGYRRMSKTLPRSGEDVVPRCRVQRRMRSHEIQAAKRRGKPWRKTRVDPEARRQPDIAKRDFAAGWPNTSSGSPISPACAHGRGLPLFAFIIACHSRMVVGWQLACHMRATLVLDALEMALDLREGALQSGSFTTPIAAARTRASTTRRRSPNTAYRHRSARSGTPTTTC
jgi:putative transposase